MLANALGEERPFRRWWPDGSVDCPFCGQPILVSSGATACPNPACDASQHATPALVLARRADDEAREAARIRRAREIDLWGRGLRRSA